MAKKVKKKVVSKKSADTKKSVKKKKELKKFEVPEVLRADSVAQLLWYSIQTDEEASEKLLSLPKKDLRYLVDLFNASVLGHLENGGKVQFMPYYTLSPKARLPRKGRNPRTGEEIQIKGSRYVSFRQGKGLKELMNKDQIKVKKALEVAKKEKEEKEAKARKKSKMKKRKSA